MSEIITRMRDVPAVADVERVTGEGAEHFRIFLKDGSEVICTRGAYERAIRVHNEEKTE